MMFDEIKKICAEQAAKIAAKGYATAEVSVVVTSKGAPVWLSRASVTPYSYESKTFYLLEEMVEYIDKLSDAGAAGIQEVLDQYASLQKKAAEMGVVLP